MKLASDYAIAYPLDRLNTLSFLRKLDFPVPQNREVYFLKDLENAIHQVGSYPVVIRPLNASSGKGITLNIDNLKNAHTACKLALTESKSGGILVEKYFAGYNYRILVVNGRVLRAIKIMPNNINSANDLSKESLVKINNNLLENKSQINIQTLESAYSNFETDKPIYIDPGRLITDSVAFDFSIEIHFENIYLAQTVAGLIRLNVLEIEMICHNLSLPVNCNEGVIINVNSYFNINQYFL